jgi:hypothetical protein
MTTLISKEKIIEACITKQQELIDSFQTRFLEMKEDVYGKSSSPSQSEHRSSGKMALLSTLETELSFAKLEMGYLSSLDATIQYDTVSPGSVVVTNHRTFFIGVSSESVDVEGQNIFGISRQAPIFSGMEGKKAGESFSFRETHYQIESVY